MPIAGLIANWKYSLNNQNKTQTVETQEDIERVFYHVLSTDPYICAEFLCPCQCRFLYWLSVVSWKWRSLVHFDFLQNDFGKIHCQNLLWHLSCLWEITSFHVSQTTGQAVKSLLLPTVKDMQACVECLWHPTQQMVGLLHNHHPKWLWLLSVSTIPWETASRRCTHHKTDSQGRSWSQVCKGRVEEKGIQIITVFARTKRQLQQSSQIAVWQH